MVTLEEGCNQIVAAMKGLKFPNTAVTRVSGKCMYIVGPMEGMFVWQTPDDKIWYSPTMGS